MKWRRLAVLLPLVLILLPAIALAGHDTNHVGLIGTAWDHTNIKVQVNVGGGVDPSVADAVQDAIDDWNEAINSLSSPYPNFELVQTFSGRPDITIVLRKGKNPLDPAVGLASIMATGDGRFFKVRVQLVGQELGEAFSATFVGNVARHELGHALGLNHSDFSDATFGDGWTGDLMQPFVPTDGDTSEIPISVCDKNAFTTAHAWYPASSPLGDPADFAAPTAPNVGC